MRQSLSSLSSSRIHAIAAPLLAAVVYGLAAMGRGIADSDEANYVHAAQQMLESGDWVTPYANGLRYLNKPPLLIWLVALSFKLFGVNELAARVPGLLGIVLTTGLVQRIAGRVAGRDAALASGLAFAFCAGTAIFTLEVMTDIVLVFFLVLAMYCFLLANDDSFRSLAPVLGFFFAIGGAFMTKSLVGIAFPMGAVLLFFLMRRRWPRVSWKSLGLGCLLTAALVVPWHIVAELRNPGFLENVIINHQILRFLGQMPAEDYMSVPLGLFWLLLLVWLFPWTLFLPAALRPGRDERLRNTRILCLSWAAVVLAVLTVSDRLEHYAFPALPPLAILIGMALASDDAATSRWVRAGFSVAAVLAILLIVTGVAILTGAVGAVGGPVSGWQKPAAEDLTDYNVILDFPAEILAQLLGWPLAVTIVGLSVGLLLALLMERAGKRDKAVLALAAAMAVFVLAASKSIEICEPVVSSKAFGVEIAEVHRPGDSVVILGDFWTANSINFYAPVRLYIHGGRAQSFHLAQQFPDAPQLKLSEEELGELWRSGKRTFVLGEPDKVEALALPDSRMILASGGRVLVSNQEK